MRKFIILSTFLMLSGCGEDVKSVDWWGEHIAEAENKKIDCDKTGSDSQNCKNVKQALFLKSQKDADPVTFE
ncbi:acetyltransferase [Salmonella enterica]|nr:acetyltransferase [Salmonella enterica]